MYGGEPQPQAVRRYPARHRVGYVHGLQRGDRILHLCRQVFRRTFITLRMYGPDMPRQEAGHQHEQPPGYQ